MKYTDLTPFRFRVFTVQELALYFQEPLPSVKVQLSRWCARKLMIRLKRNCYTFPDTHPPGPILAGYLVSPSYTSLEEILSESGIIPESVFTHTGVTSKKTQHYQTPLGRFSYRHLSPRLFFGVKRRDDGACPGSIATDGAWVATPEKALLDYLYLNSGRFQPKPLCWQAERFDQLDQLNWKQLKEWAPKYRMKKLVTLVDSLEQYFHSPAYQQHR